MRFAGPLALALLLPLAALAALININTADSALLQTLPGIGPTKAQAIIDYRTQHGPFVRIEDIQNVSGIGDATYNGIKDLITVGETVSTPPATSTPVTVSGSGSGANTYTPPPASLSLNIGGPTVALQNAPLHLIAEARVKGGALDTAAQITWSFGDGSAQTGTAVDKVYRYLGTYLVTAKALDGSARASDELLVKVIPATIRITVAGEGITVMNNSSERLDLSGWRLASEAGSFRIPEGTVLLPQMGTLFPYAITNLPRSASANLRYPDGMLAASSAVAVDVPMQPSSLATSSYVIQTSDPLISASVTRTTYAQPVVAPAAATELAAAGAPVSDDPPPAAQAPLASVTHTGWLAGLLGVIVLAGGAFIFI